MRLACVAAFALVVAFPATAAPSAAAIRDRIALAWIDPDSNVRVDVVPLSEKWAGPGTVIGRGGEAKIVAVADLFVVVWLQQSGLVATRLTLDGVVLDPSPLKIAETARLFFSVGSSGKTVLAVWSTQTELRTAVITPAGVVIPSIEPLADFHYGGGSGAIAWDGRQYLVSWGYATNSCTFHCFPMPPGESFWSLLDEWGTPASPSLRPPIADSSIAAGGGAFLIVGSGFGYSTAFARVLSQDAIDGPHVLNDRYLGPLYTIWTGSWFAVVLANRVIRIAADGTVIDRDDGFSIPTGWIYAVVLTPRGLVAVSEEAVSKRPLLEIVVPWPKQRAARLR
jgi:hypothetical protein